jgi:3-oxoadipate enol-lactonase
VTLRGPEPIVARHGSGVPILLLHALGVDRRLWNGLLALLPGRALLTYEFPGHGQVHGPTEPFTVHDLAEQLAGALRGGGWTRAHVLGVSLGGLVAQDLAAHHPDLVERLVLVDTVATYPPEQIGRWHERAALARSSGMGPIVAGTLETWFTAGFLAEGGPQVQSVRAMFATTDPQVYALACEALADADTRELVSRISAPTLVVCGDDDMPAFVRAAEWLATNIPRAELCWLSPARHLGILELPEQFATQVLDFIEAT